MIRIRFIVRSLTNVRGGGSSCNVCPFFRPIDDLGNIKYPAVHHREAHSEGSRVLEVLVVYR